MKPNEHRSEAERFLEHAKVLGRAPDSKRLDLLYSIAHGVLAGPEEEVIHVVSGDTPGEALDRARAVQVRQVLINIMKARRPGAPVRGDESLDDLIEAVKRTEPGEWTKPSLRVYGTQTVAEWESRARAVVDPDVPVNVDAVRDYLHQALAEIDQLRETLADRDGRLADRNRELARLRGDDDAV